MMITKSKLIFITIYTIIYVMLSPIVYLITNEGLHIMMIWNLFLAWIPLGIMILMSSGKVKKNWLIGILFFIWLVFFPNAIYIISDLIYLDQSQFIQSIGPDQSLIYLQDFAGYIGFFHLVFGAILGMMLAVASLKPLLMLIEERKNRKMMIFALLGISFLSSIAVFIGRFFRYNSWDIFKGFQIFVEMYQSISWFSVMFVIGFTILQVLIYSLMIGQRSQEVAIFSKK